MRIAFTFLLAVAFAMGKAQPVAVFHHASWDYGSVPDTVPHIAHSFIFYNRGDAPLLINNMLGCCTYDSYTYPKEAILPGDSGIITVAYDVGFMHGYFEKTVMVVTNAGQIILKSTGTIAGKEATQLVPENSVWNFGEIQTNISVKHTIKLLNPGTEPIVILRAQNSGGCAIVSDYTEEPILPGRWGSIELMLNCSALGPVNKSFLVYTSAGAVPIRLEAKGVIVPEATPVPYQK